MFDWVKIKGKIIKRDMSNDDLLEFLNLPSDTKVYDSCYTCIDEDEIFLFRYFDETYINITGYLRYIVRVGYVNNRKLVMHNSFGGYSWICFSRNSVSFSRYFNNQLHSITNNANVVYKKGILVKEVYKKHGVFHNIQGPAIRLLNNNNVWDNYFIYNGKDLTLKEYCEVVERRWNNVRR